MVDKSTGTWRVYRRNSLLIKPEYPGNTNTNWWKLGVVVGYWCTAEADRPCCKGNIAYVFCLGCQRCDRHLGLLIFHDERAERGVVITTASTYRTVSESGLIVIAGATLALLRNLKLSISSWEVVANEEIHWMSGNSLQKTNQRIDGGGWMNWGPWLNRNRCEIIPLSSF